MKVLITGGVGFIGSSLSEKLLSMGFTITAVDNFNSYYNSQFKRENIAPFLNNPNYLLAEVNITDNQFLEAVFPYSKI